MSSRGGAATGSAAFPGLDEFLVSPSISKAILDDNSKASYIFICGATGKQSRDINGLYSKAFFKPECKGHDGRIMYGRACGGASAGDIRIMHHDGYWGVKHSSFKLSDGFFARVKGGCALEACASGVWQIHDERGPGFHDQPKVKMFTGNKAVINYINSKATDMVISGVTGPNSHINGLYSPTQERGQYGLIVYRKMGSDPLCIEHFAGEWQVKAESDRGSGACVASVEGDCALENCGFRKWRVMSGKEFVIEPNVKAMTIKEAQRKVSGHGILVLKCIRPLPSIFSCA